MTKTTTTANKPATKPVTKPSPSATPAVNEPKKILTQEQLYAMYTASTCSIETIETTLGAWLNTKVALASCQRSVVFNASFEASLGESAMHHDYIPTIVCVLADDGKTYLLVDGQQRTIALADFRLRVPEFLLDWYDNCPIRVDVVKLRDGLTQGEFFMHLNSSNAPTRTQAAKGLYCEDVMKVMDVCADPDLISALYKRITKATTATDASFEVQRVAQLDNILAGFTWASISPKSPNANFSIIAKKLVNPDRLENLDDIIDGAKRRVACVTEILESIGKNDERQKLYRVICQPKILMPLFSVADCKPEYLLSAILSLFTDAGEAKATVENIKFQAPGETVKEKISWTNLINDNRSNDGATTQKRAAFFKHFVSKQENDEALRELEAETAAAKAAQGDEPKTDISDL